MKKRVVVHPRVDLDALVCIALSGADHVDFLPAGADHIPHSMIGARILDHPLGTKGTFDGKRRHAACCSMPEAQKCDPRLLDEADEQDSTGTTSAPRFSLAELVAAVRSELSHTYKGENLDRKIIDIFSTIFRSINKRYGAVKITRANALTLPLVTIAGHKFALVSGKETGPGLAKILNLELGVSGTIFWGRLGKGVSRFPGQESPDLTKLAKNLPSWFVHQSGFLVCWGCRKNPRSGNPPEGTPQTKEQLVKLLKEVYET